MNRPKQDIMKLFQQDPKPFEVASTPVAQRYEVDIDEEFVHVSQFSQLVNILEQATENDLVQIRLTSPGGSVASVIPLISALENTEAFVHVHVDSDVASAATFIVLKAHMVTMNKHLSFMIHTASWGYGGHSGNMEASTTHYVKSIKGLARDVYSDFLTEPEFERVFNGQEIWLTPEEVYERLKVRAEKLQKQEEEQPVEEKAKKPARKKREKPPTAAEVIDLLKDIGKEE
jgi:ATP-dependent protease ClpP protease subunit